MPKTLPDHEYWKVLLKIMFSFYEWQLTYFRYDSKPFCEKNNAFSAYHKNRYIETVIGI